MKHKHRYVLRIEEGRPEFICECGTNIKMKVTEVELIGYETD